MIEFTFEDYIRNAIQGDNWHDRLAAAFLIIVLYDWLCTFYRKPVRSEWIARNLAGITLIVLYAFYYVFVYMKFRAEPMQAFDYAHLIATVSGYAVGLNLYFLVKKSLMHQPFLKNFQEPAGFFILFVLYFIYAGCYNNLVAPIQIFLIDHFFAGKGVRPFSNDGVDMGLFYFYNNLEAALLFAGANSIVNNFLNRQRRKDLSKELEVSTLKSQLLQTQVESLNSRINPHFLYNALNSIAALALNDAAKCRDMVIMLSKLFRYNVNREQEAFAEIEEEAEMIRSYLNIEKIRFEENLQFELKIADEVKKMKMPRFLLQPLIENALKHGLNIDHKLSIEVKIFSEDAQLVMQVADNGTPFSEGFVPGYGFKSVYDKLSLLYPENYEVSVIREPIKMVELKINLTDI